MKLLKTFLFAALFFNFLTTISFTEMQSALPSETGNIQPLEMGYTLVKQLNSPVKDGFFVNVLQDCWITDQESAHFDIEQENYLLYSSMPVVYVWKHKIFEPCKNYVARIVGFRCVEGKVKISAKNIVFNYDGIKFGPIEPGAEYIFWVVMPPLTPGLYDWILVVEPNDTNGTIPGKKDKDIDDVCGANLGLPPANPLGPVIFGPEPSEILDPDMGGTPPGRVAGEEGVTRGWCFQVW